MFYMITDSGVSVTEIGKKALMVATDHPNYQAILEALSAADATYDKVAALADIKATFASKVIGNVSFSINEKNDIVVKIDDREVGVIDACLERRIAVLLKDKKIDETTRDMALNSIAKFVVNLYKNPSNKSVTQLYGFIQHNDLPITQNGTFLAYKKVGSDYFDIHSGTMDNSIGKVVEMPRNEVEDNPEVTCSHGLHVCSHDYLEHYGSSGLDHVMIVEVNPADVVSVPYDYNNAKMRVCKYTVIDEIPNAFDAELSKYTIGTHTSGWMRDTFQKIHDFYVSFFNIDTGKFKWTHAPALDFTINVAYVAKFYDALQKAFPEIADKLPHISTCGICAPADIFKFLSNYSDIVGTTDNDAE